MNGYSDIYFSYLKPFREIKQKIYKIVHRVFSINKDTRLYTDEYIQDSLYEFLYTKQMSCYGYILANNNISCCLSFMLSLLRICWYHRVYVFTPYKPFFYQCPRFIFSFPFYFESFFFLLLFI